MPNPQVKAFVHEITTPRVVFRIGAAADIVPESERLDGRRVLLIGAGHQHDLADRIAKSLGDRLAGRITEVAAHVPVPVARAAIDAARDLGADQLLSMSGGSATGLAKAVALELGVPILAVRTTYAGSEMSPIWRLTDARGKRTGRDARVLPRTVIYDPVGLDFSIWPGQLSWLGSPLSDLLGGLPGRTPPARLPDGSGPA